MICSSTTEFVKRFGIIPNQQDIVMMRFQRIISLLDIKQFEVSYDIIRKGKQDCIYYNLVFGNTALRANPNDGSFHIPWDGSMNMIDIHVPKRAFKFKGSSSIIKAFNRKIEAEAHEVNRKAKLLPFQDEIGHWKVRGKRVSIDFGNNVDDDGRISISIIGKFTLDEAKTLMEGVKESHIVDLDLIDKIMSS